MSFKPSNDRPVNTTTAFKPHAPIHRSLEEGVEAVAVSTIIDLGDQLVEPEVKKDETTGKEYTTRTKKVQRVAMYVDLLNCEHDYGDEIGVKQPRLPLHNEFAGTVTGLSFEAHHPRQKENEKLYDFTRPKVIMSNSTLGKIAKAVKEDCILDENSPHRNDISRLVNKPFAMELVIKEGKEKPENKRYDEEDTHYVNTYVKTVTKLMKGVAASPLQAEPLVLTFGDDVETLVEGLKTVRVGVKKAIMGAINYEGSNMQKALQELGEEEKYIYSEDNTWGVKVGESKEKWEEYLAEKEAQKIEKEAAKNSGTVDLVDEAKKATNKDKEEDRSQGSQGNDTLPEGELDDEDNIPF